MELSLSFGLLSMKIPNCLCTLRICWTINFVLYSLGGHHRIALTLLYFRLLNPPPPRSSSIFLRVCAMSTYSPSYLHFYNTAIIVIYVEFHPLCRWHYFVRVFHKNLPFEMEYTAAGMIPRDQTLIYLRILLQTQRNVPHCHGPRNITLELSGKLILFAARPLRFIEFEFPHDKGY